MERYSEELLQYLAIDANSIDHWYKACHFVKNVLPPLDGNGIGPDSDKRVHVLFKDFSPLMLAVVRQICLVAHYPNFDEEHDSNKTLITICADHPVNAYNTVRATKYLGHLLAYCSCRVEGEPIDSSNDRLPLDIEFEFVKNYRADKNDDDVVVITTDEIERATASCTKAFDVTMGMLVNMVYHTGAEIDNLPAYDNANIERYSTALNMFCYKIKQQLILQKWNDCAPPKADGSYHEMDVKNKLSSIFCADCFDARIRGLIDTREKSLAEYLQQDFDMVMKKICDAKTITALAKSEHARWNVEKLIMGFQPLEMEDWYEIESCFGSERKDKIKKLKKKGRHIDICSCKDLRRVNPADIKYDYFLMLAMPQIMRSYLLAK